MNKSETNKLMEVVERLTRMESKLDLIETHTSKMNEELGVCQEDIKLMKEKIIIVRLSWKRGIALVGVTGTLVTIIYTLLRIFSIIK